MGSIDKAVKTFKIDNFQGLDIANFQLLKAQFFNLLLTTFLHTSIYIHLLTECETKT